MIKFDKDILTRQKVLERRRSQRASPYDSDHSDNSYNRNFPALNSRLQNDNPNYIPIKQADPSSSTKPPDTMKPPCSLSNANSVGKGNPTNPTHNAKLPSPAQKIIQPNQFGPNLKPDSTRNPIDSRAQPDGDFVMEDGRVGKTRKRFPQYADAPPTLRQCAKQLKNVGNKTGCFSKPTQQNRPKPRKPMI